MRRIFLLFLLFLGISSSAIAQQKVCYIYSQKIFQSMPAYRAAVKTLEDMTEMYQTKCDALFDEVKQMYTEFQQTQDRMTQTQYDRFKTMIINKEKAANDYEEQIFGDDGLIAKQQKVLMEPIEKRVLAAVNSFAAKYKFDMIYDLSLVKVTIYQSPTLDMTDAIIKMLN